MCVCKTVTQNQNGLIFLYSCVDSIKIEKKVNAYGLLIMNSNVFVCNLSFDSTTLGTANI